jgi:hypothetical protein
VLALGQGLTAKRQRWGSPGRQQRREEEEEGEKQARRDREGTNEEVERG